MANQAQDQWVARVLGISAAAASPTQTAVAGDAAKRWQALWLDAKDAVDGGINELAAALRDEGDPDLDQIADRGLIGITGGNSVRMTKALLMLRAATPDTLASASAALRDAAISYRDTVFAHPIIDLIDDNPWGIEVGCRSRLGAALETIIAEAA